LKPVGLSAALALLLSVISVACGPSWSTHRSIDGDFTVQLPGEPHPLADVEHRPSGERHVRGVEARLEDNILPSRHFAAFRVYSYKVLGPTATPRDIAARIDEARDENLAVPELHATLVSDTPLQRPEGREVIITFGADLRLVERAFVRGDRIYRVDAVEKRTASRAYTDRFLSSFQFTDPVH
jgi:hypothetical protein